MSGWKLSIDPMQGGRWTSLVDAGGREWLWRRDDPVGRNTARPGSAFIDVGGVEECFPTIGGVPDHGDVWTRPWRRGGEDADGQWWSVQSGPFTLARAFTTGSEIRASYQLTGPPGSRFLWSAHAAVKPDLGTVIVAAPGRCRAWPGHADPVETEWPGVLGRANYPVLGRDDGSAMFCALLGCTEMAAQLGDARLQFTLDCPQQPVAMGLWRNLNGYPWDGRATYRNCVIEPMLGHVFDLAGGSDDDLARMPQSGALSWRLTISG